LCSVTFFSRKSYRLWENVAKYGRVGQATDDNMAQGHCMLDTKNYKHTLRICNAYSSSAAAMVAGMRLSTTLHRTLRLSTTLQRTLPVLLSSHVCIIFQTLSWRHVSPPQSCVLLSSPHTRYIILIKSGVELRPMISGSVGPCHHGMARLQVATAGTACNIEGRWEYIE
jgi:hypothetical protein